MYLTNNMKRLYLRRQYYSCIRKYCKKNDVAAQDHIRNIGILAHIDAGKTTTTERMLFYSGRTRSMGEVHHGNTVTDYLEQERQRGITICSAAVTFKWNNYCINLVDTPGHIDFTMEVEQSLAALDGAIVILDASAGVEAQTVTVWNQADRHRLPRIVFANKMDRSDADLGYCLKSLKKRLGANPICLQLPLTNKNQLTGLMDLITLEQITWENSERGRLFKRSPLTGDNLDKAIKERCILVDNLTDLDDRIADYVIACESIENVESSMILEAIRNATIKQIAVPVLCGSAYKNLGVQPLMDAVTYFLPHPMERNYIYNCFCNDPCARVFKVVHDKQRGPLCWIRVMRGDFKKGSKVVSHRGGSTEVLNRIYEPLADDLLEVQQISTGNIGVVAGLKTAATGDLLVSNTSSLNNAKKQLAKILEKQNLDKTIKEDSRLPAEFSFETHIPDPVFFCSVEPPSLSQAAALETALSELQREDPSLRVRVDEETGQTVLGGMGELHLEVIKDRILTQYKVEADLGPMQIAYRERPDDINRTIIESDKVIGSTRNFVKIELSVGPTTGKDPYRLDKSPESQAVLTLFPPRLLQAVKRGAEGALSRGPRMGCPVVDAEIILHHLEISRGTAVTFVSACAAQCVHKALSEGSCRLLEPLMSVQIVTPEESLSSVLADLSRRRSNILMISNRMEQKVVDAVVPLNELLGYAGILRSLCSGAATFTMEPQRYAPMGPLEEAQAVRNMSGF